MDVFRTTVPVSKAGKGITYNSKLLFTGSCFSDYIADKFINYKYSTDANPFGTVYNPLSIKKGLLRLIEGNNYQEVELFQQDDIWYSFDHHGRFSGTEKENVLEGINQQLHFSSASLKEADFLFITFGTSIIYQLKSTGQVVSNCHKVPAGEFVRRKISVEEIIKEYSTLIETLFKYNPNISVVFTVSPVRHWKDGAHQNQLSKSVLLLAIDQLCNSHPQTFYFPSYEIMMDDLRDYRFYTEDMLHPDKVAINYIWQRLKESFMNSDTIRLMDEVEKIIQACNHKPFNPGSTAFRTFCNKFADESRVLMQKHGIDLIREEQYFRSFL